MYKYSLFHNFATTSKLKYMNSGWHMCAHRKSKLNFKKKKSKLELSCAASDLTCPNQTRTFSTSLASRVDAEDRESNHKKGHTFAT